MACDVFETEAWFANLLAHGFERPPHKNWEWQLPALQHGHAAHLHLMQQSPGEPLAALSTYYSCLYGPVGSVEAIHDLSAPQWRAAVQALRQLLHPHLAAARVVDGPAPGAAGNPRRRRGHALPSC